MVEIETTDATLDEIRNLADVVEHGDVKAFIDIVDERGHTNDDGKADIEDLDDVTLPFYEEDRAITVLLAFSAGAAIERKYTDHGDERSVERVYG